MSVSLKDKLIQTLIESESISQKDIDDAIRFQKKNKIGLDKALVEKGLIKEEDLLMLLVRELNIPFINLSKYKIDSSLMDVIPEKIARQYGIVPLSALDKTMTVAISDPFNVFAIDDLKNLTGKEIDVVMSTNEEILKAISAFYGESSTASFDEIREDFRTEDFEIVEEEDDSVSDIDSVDESEKAPIIRMVNLIIRDALKQRASDIHMEPMEDSMRVRYRVDGVLRNVLDVPKESQNAVIVRIKIMSRLDITSSMIPQDGRFKLKSGKKEVDFRVSLLPTTHGQKVVMRVLDKANLSVGLGGLGLTKKALDLVDEAIKKPFGMILVTGPTGSGKSTTLYSMISELNTIDKNIITVEDPVEYLIEGLTQIHAHPEIGLTFAAGLRSILRQSPDVVMVGEIRDNETADIAIKASLTGQLVLSTLHTNDASGTLTRLIDMGVEPFLVASSLVLVSAQRLCRKICTACKEERDIPPDILSRLKFEIPSKTKFYHGKGCDACEGSGYLGRMSITEILDIDDTIREMLLEGKSSEDIKQYAVKEKGMDTLFSDAMRKCMEGSTTIEEVLRVTSED